MKKIDLKQLNRSELKNVFGGKLAQDPGEVVPVLTLVVLMQIPKLV